MVLRDPKTCTLVTQFHSHCYFIGKVLLEVVQPTTAKCIVSPRDNDQFISSHAAWVKEQKLKISG